MTRKFGSRNSVALLWAANFVDILYTSTISKIFIIINIVLNHNVVVAKFVWHDYCCRNLILAITNTINIVPII